MKFYIFFVGLIITLTSFSFHSITPNYFPSKFVKNSSSDDLLHQNTDSTKTENVYGLLIKLGETHNNHEINKNIPESSPLKGKDIFNLGYTTNSSGQTTDIQSKYFVCTSCHNNVIEDPNLRRSNPQARLTYAKKNNLPFLQGTTVYGIVNRKSFYNGSYYLKYGKEKVAKAHDNIREAIQLCAVGCAQGRPLEEWEIESVLEYFWSLQFKISDIDMSSKELDFIEAAKLDSNKMDSARILIKSKFAEFSPATFVTPPPNRKIGYENQGDPNNGKDIYELSCLHCHKNGKYSYYYLDQTSMSLRHLRHHFPKFSNYSSYQVIRWGTHPLIGKKAYMPQYTLERMSNQQVEDLRSYFEHPF